MTRAALLPPRSINSLPLDEDARTRSAAARRSLEDIVAVGELGALTSLITTVGGELRDQGVRFLAAFSPRLGTQASIAVAFCRLRPPSAVDEAFAEPAIAALLRLTEESRPFADCRLVDLPAGPAAASVVAGQFDLPAEMTGPTGTVTIPTFRAEFLVPTPEWDGIVVLDISTTDEDAWPEVAREAVRIAQSLRFLRDGESAREGEHLLRL